MNSGRVGGLTSNEPPSSGITLTAKPARRIRQASTWSWLRISPPSGGLPGKCGIRQCGLKASVRMIALWPQ